MFGIIYCLHPQCVKLYKYKKSLYTHLERDHAVNNNELLQVLETAEIRFGAVYNDILISDIEPERCIINKNENCLTSERNQLISTNITDKQFNNSINITSQLINKLLINVTNQSY